MSNLSRSLAFLLLAAACGGDDGGTTTSETSTSTTTDGTSTSSTTAPGSTSGSSGGSTSGGSTGDATGSTSGASATTGPLPPCDEAADRPACEAMNTDGDNPICGWIDVVPVDDSCGFGSAPSECVPLLPTGGCDDANTCAGGPGDELWWRDGANGKELFQANFCDHAPVGWTRCEWDAGVGKDTVEPAACACGCP